MTEEPKFLYDRPCKYGHTQRYISTGDCVICARERDRQRKRKNKEKKSEEIPFPITDFQHRVTVLGNPDRINY